MCVWGVADGWGALREGEADALRQKFPSRVGYLILRVGRVYCPTVMPGSTRQERRGGVAARGWLILKKYIFKSD